jgi:tRNA(His) 5'-end guanylyltransferase
MTRSLDYADIGARMKLYEGAESLRHIMLGLPVIARLDGKAFHNFTKGLNRPHDARFDSCMVGATEALIAQTGAIIGYTQSDEITLIWPSCDNLAEFWLGGRYQKMCSVLAAIATVEFGSKVRYWLPDSYVYKKPVFDCRVWQVPSEAEAANVLVWREHDAVKNSRMALALHVSGHAKVLGKSQNKQLDLIKEAGQRYLRCKARSVVSLYS